MTYKNIEAAREVRLWVTHIILPIGIVSYFVFSNPKIRAEIKYTCEKVKSKFRKNKPYEQ